MRRGFEAGLMMVVSSGYCAAFLKNGAVKLLKLCVDLNMLPAKSLSIVNKY
jgi:hypothetical protein